MNERELGGAGAASPSQRATWDERVDYWRGSWGPGDTSFGDGLPRRARDRVSDDEVGAALLVALGVVLVAIKFWFDLAG